MPEDWTTSALPVRRVERRRQHAPSEAPPDPRAWPQTLPAVAQLLRDGLDLAAATVLVGENGSGKSTLVEAIALAFGLSPEGGSTGARHSTRPSESGLHDHLFLDRGPGASRWGYFLRAETTHGLFTYLEENPGFDDARFHELSHGESFVAMLGTRRFAGDGFFVLDEPEAGLSFTAQLHLLATLRDLAERPGTQVLLATHSPVLAALPRMLPDARLLELGEHGIRSTTWEDLDTVAHHRSFLEAPERYLRHL